jgi:hypothetical protein
MDNKNDKTSKINNLGNNICKNYIKFKKEFYDDYKNDDIICSFSSNYKIETYDSFYKKMCLIVVNLKNKEAYLNGRSIFVYKMFDLNGKIGEELKSLLFPICEKEEVLKDKKIILIYLKLKNLSKNYKYLSKNINHDYSDVFLIDYNNLNILGNIGFFPKEYYPKGDK